MKELIVTDFSVIGSAHLSLRRLTVLVGPQASGKSLLSKLCYFFLELLPDQDAFLTDGRSFGDFKEHIKEKFMKWFPSSAWGNGKFMIEFRGGEFKIRLTRMGYRGKSLDRVRIWTSDFFEEQYHFVLESVRTKLAEQERSDRRPPFTLMWDVQKETATRFAHGMGRDYVGFQLFVPAGRSFFTNLGKAITAFEHGQILDPLTVQFGRLVSSRRADSYSRSADDSFWRRSQALVEVVLGGRVKTARGEEYVETKDGRKIPFFALSSGQQELLPLWQSFKLLSFLHERTILLYIEEPEAHLFPSAQSKLMEFMGGFISHRETIDLVITTHSPYVLSKINNMLKAGALARHYPEKIREIDRVVPRHAWLVPDDVGPFAIHDGRLMRIMDEECLIDASYLDEVSGDIAREFSKLLEIEIAADG